jgi:hypothetical protein
MHSSKTRTVVAMTLCMLSSVDRTHTHQVPSVISMLRFQAPRDCNGVRVKKLEVVMAAVEAAVAVDDRHRFRIEADDLLTFHFRRRRFLSVTLKRNGRRMTSYRPRGHRVGYQRRIHLRQFRRQSVGHCIASVQQQLQHLLAGARCLSSGPHVDRYDAVVEFDETIENWRQST